LYDRLPVKCKQCERRFPDGPLGKKKLGDHLDMHFRQNRKTGQAVGRGHSRSWFISIDDFLNDVADKKGKRRETSGPSSSLATNSEASKRDEELRASYIVVPSGDEAKSISCPVCKELLKSEFLDEEEEWVWKNAVRVKDKIYHATCHAEMAASSTLAAKLRAEGAGSSRVMTPDITDSNRLTPTKASVSGSVLAEVQAKLRASKSPTPERPLAGTKRKAEDEPAGLDDSCNRTPPFKKVAAVPLTVV